MRAGKLDKSDVVSPSTSSADSGKAADAKETGDALEPLQFAYWYPDGSVASSSDFTSGIGYANYASQGTSFAYSFSSGNANASLAGRVVIPPYNVVSG